MTTGKTTDAGRPFGPGTLADLRKAFFGRDLDSHGAAAMSACMLDAHAMASNVEALTEFSRTLRRHLRAFPLASAECEYYGYVADDLRESGVPALVDEAERIFAGIEKARNDAARIRNDQARGMMTAIHDIPAPPSLNERDAIAGIIHSDLAAFLREHYEPFWSVSGEADQFAAIIAEVEETGSTPEGRDELVRSLFMNGNFDHGMILFQFFEALCESLVNSKRYEWAEAVCMGALRRHQSHRNITGLLIEANFKMKEFERALLLLEGIEKQIDIPAYFVHIKTVCLMMLKRFEEASRIVRARLVKNPKDADAALIGGDMLMDKGYPELAIRAYAHAYHAMPQEFYAAAALATAFHSAYLPVQADACLRAMADIDPERARLFQLGSEVYIKCAADGAKGLVDGMNAGPCPARITGLPPGPHRIGWKTPGGTAKEIEVNVPDAHVCKYKLDTVTGRVDEEITRDGLVQCYRGGKTIPLPELISGYLVEDLRGIPAPGLDEFLSEELINEVFGSRG